MVNNRRHFMWQLFLGKGVMPPLLFINWMDKLSRTDECVAIGRCKIRRLLFADDQVLQASPESGLQHLVNGFAAASEKMQK